tara:strand:+ start:252 stop:395 length:144 start_codon:yes stop_codon:yes gene_type:complete
VPAGTLSVKQDRFPQKQEFLLALAGYGFLAILFRQSREQWLDSTWTS